MGYIENIKSIMQWGNSFERQGNFPLDRTDLHISYEDAVLYAKGDGSDSRKLGKLAYIGQTITVWGLNEKNKEGVWVYSLVPHTPVDENDTTLADLKPVGSTTTETAETYSAAVTLSEGLVVGQLILVATEETVEEQTYKAGFYIVNAPGSISALDTSTGASDEIGAISNRVAALEGNRVLKSDFEEYQGTVTTALSSKVDGEAFTEYQGTVETALGSKVDSEAFTEYQGTVETALGSKVDSESFTEYQGTVTTALGSKVDGEAFTEYQGTVTTALDAKVDDLEFSTYKEEVSGNLDTKVSNDDFEEYQGTVETALGGKVDGETFTEYQGTVTTALGGKVDSEAFTEYQGTVTTALDGKANASDLSTLSGRVDADIQNLTNLLGDYSGTLSDVDDRLGDLESFVEEHKSIPVSEIEGLFTQSND